MKNKVFYTFLLAALLAASACVMQVRAEDADQKIEPKITCPYLTRDMYALIKVPFYQTKEITTEPIKLCYGSRLFVKAYIPHALLPGEYTGDLDLSWIPGDKNDSSILANFENTWIPENAGQVVINFTAGGVTVHVPVNVVEYTF